MKIGELARVTGTNAKTIRFYEAEGLMPEPPRTPAGYRSYSTESVSRLDFILKAKRVGLSLHEILGILRLHDAEQSTWVLGGSGWLGTQAAAPLALVRYSTNGSSRPTRSATPSFSTT